MLNLVEIANRLKSIESLAYMPRVTSTNVLGRRVIQECIENEIPLPKAIILASEQSGGLGRIQRRWHSPAGQGIYSTTLYTCTPEQLKFLPLRVAVIVAGFLREVYAVDARIKWPNDLLVNGNKIAGILLEARLHEDAVYTLVGVGINVLRTEDLPNASTSVSQVSHRDSIDIESATVAFIEHLDEALSREAGAEETIEQWNELTVHRSGDSISCVIGDQTVTGTWAGIDESGRALLRQGEKTLPIAAGDLILDA